MSRQIISVWVSGIQNRTNLDWLKKAIRVISFATLTVMIAIIISLLDVANWELAFHIFILIAGVIGFLLALLTIRIEAETIAFFFLSAQIVAQLVLIFLRGSFTPVDEIINAFSFWEKQSLILIARVVYSVTTIIWFVIYTDFLGIRTKLANRIKNLHQ